MNPVEKWRKNQREKEKKKRKAKEKKMREENPNYGKKAPKKEESKYKKIMPSNEELPMEMQIKRKQYWKKQEAMKKKLSTHSKKMESFLKSTDKKIEIKPPIEAPPLPDDEYPSVFHDCLENKVSTGLPDQEFIIHIIKKQIALKKKKMQQKMKEFEEKQQKEIEKLEMKEHMEKMEKEAKERNIEIEKEKLGMGTQVAPGMYVSRPSFTNEYVQEKVNKQQFIPTAIIQKKLKVENHGNSENEDNNITQDQEQIPADLEDLGLDDIIIKPAKATEKISEVKQTELDLVPKPEFGLIGAGGDSDDSDFASSSDEDEGGNGIGMALEPLKMGSGGIELESKSKIDEKKLEIGSNIDKELAELEALAGLN